MFRRNLSPPTPGSKTSQARNQREVLSKQNRYGSLLGLFFDPEDGEEAFTLNVV
jgi:hypothetical protein